MKFCLREPFKTWFAIAIVDFVIISTIIVIIQSQWAIHLGKPIGVCLYYYVKNYFPFHCIGLIFFAFISKSSWKKLFSWKLFVGPILGLVVLSFSQWKLNSLLNYECYIFGYQWSWIALITWSLLFITQLFLYQRKHVDNALSFVLSVYGVFLAQLIYEIPYYYRARHNLFFLNEAIIGVFFISILLYKGWRPRHRLILGLMPLLGWATIFSFSSFPAWLPRLTTIPFFLMFPMDVKNMMKRKNGIEKPVLVAGGGLHIWHGLLEVEKDYLVRCFDAYYVVLKDKVGIIHVTRFDHRIADFRNNI